MLRTTVVLTGPPGAPFYSTLHWAGSTFGEAEAAADAHGHFWNQLAGRLRTDMTATVQTEVPNIDVATGNITEMFTVGGGTVDFTGSANPLPEATQGLLRLRTGDYVAGRELRGRMFIPGATENDNDTGNPDPTFTAALTAAWTYAMTTGGGSAAGGAVVYSPTHRAASQVTAVSPWNEWAVLRSRRG